MFILVAVTEPHMDRDTPLLRFSPLFVSSHVGRKHRFGPFHGHRGTG